MIIEITVIKSPYFSKMGAYVDLLKGPMSMIVAIYGEFSIDVFSSL